MGLPSNVPLWNGNSPNGSILVGEGKETKYGIPLVAASEMGKVQTESHGKPVGDVELRTWILLNC